ncbi:hypothetical protein ACFROC_05215 [Nocardia tengchongensis]|uniref:hypothetical protein n=1 Tax=Nocardia tengchongensis TaxID=2055889 RepID=UPI0036815A90
MDAATVACFEASRNRLASLAYRLLGSAAAVGTWMPEPLLDGDPMLGLPKPPNNANR